MTTLFHFAAPVKPARPFGLGVPETDGQIALRRAFNHLFPACSRRGKLDQLDTPAAPAGIDPWDVECDPADWPADTDEWVWVPTGTGPAPRARAFEPSPEDRSWWAAESERLAADRAAADLDAAAAEAWALDQIERGLTPHDFGPDSPGCEARGAWGGHPAETA
jgi:hypothetical protein